MKMMVNFKKPWMGILFLILVLNVSLSESADQRKLMFNFVLFFIELKNFFLVNILMLQ